MMGTNPARDSLLDLSSALMSLRASRRRRDRIKSVFLGRIYQLFLQNVRSSETNTFNASMIRCLKQSRTGFCKIQTHFTPYEKCRYEKRAYDSAPDPFVQENVVKFSSTTLLEGTHGMLEWDYQSH